jgi:DNA-binding MarR family transcriptional regulator
LADADAPQLSHTGNLLGALALILTDRMADAVAAASGEALSGAIALSAVDRFLGVPSIDLLRQVLGLTSSGTVRLVDRLESAGLVTRESGRDARTTLVALTPEGQAAARRVAAARTEVLEGALVALDERERATFERLLSKVLPQFVRRRGAVRWLCRMCDTTACGRQAGQCPVADAAHAADVTPR